MSTPILDLDLHKHKDKLKIKKEGDQTLIWDIIRKKYLVLQPEELVRQLLAHFLIHDMDYPKSYIQFERGIKVHQMAKRFDIIVMDRHVNPFLLIECKSHRVKLTQETFDQVSNYNQKIKAPYILISNGVQSFCAHIDQKMGNYHFTDIPDYPSKDKSTK